MRCPGCDRETSMFAVYRPEGWVVMVPTRDNPRLWLVDHEIWLRDQIACLNADCASFPAKRLPFVPAEQEGEWLVDDETWMEELL